MADLTTEGVYKFWSQFQDKSIQRVVTFMDGVEYWTLDGNSDLEDAMKKLSTKLEDVGKTDLDEKDKFIHLCCYLKASRSLRLMHSMDTNNPGCASKLLIYAEENGREDNPYASLFLRRNIVFERLRLLSRIFAPPRLALITKALEEEND